MATYLVGDIQGCFHSLIALTELIKFTEADRLCLVGDLVNRGPCSLEVLEWVYARRDQVQIVLGNHDLHLLACSAGASFGRSDTLEAIFDSPSSREWMDWLRQQPVLWEAEIAGKWVAMVHAGLNPKWKWDEVRRRAAAIEEALQSEGGLDELAAAHPRRKAHLNSGKAHHRVSEYRPWVDDLGWFTRVRAVDRKLERSSRFKGSLDELPMELTPWFTHYEELREPSMTPDMLYFGHWAALGVRRGEGYTSLDTGCIWGRSLSAVRVEDGELFQIPTLEAALTPKHRRGVAERDGMR